MQHEVQRAQGEARLELSANATSEVQADDVLDVIDLVPREEPGSFVLEVDEVSRILKQRFGRIFAHKEAEPEEEIEVEVEAEEPSESIVPVALPSGRADSTLLIAEPRRRAPWGWTIAGICAIAAIVGGAALVRDRLATPRAAAAALAPAPQEAPKVEAKIEPPKVEAKTEAPRVEAPKVAKPESGVVDISSLPLVPCKGAKCVARK